MIVCAYTCVSVRMYVCVCVCICLCVGMGVGVYGTVRAAAVLFASGVYVSVCMCLRVCVWHSVCVAQCGSALTWRLFFVYLDTSSKSSLWDGYD